MEDREPFILKGEASLVKAAETRPVSHNTSMLRDRNLIPLSHQHQHALALCVRIERASRKEPVNLASWQAEIASEFEQEIQFHFAAEEQVLFPAARRFSELEQLVDELLDEHAQLRYAFSRAKVGAMDTAELGQFTQLLSSHIRKEERRLFEQMQKLLSPPELGKLGAELERTLQAAVQACRISRPKEES